MDNLKTNKQTQENACKNYSMYACHNLRFLLFVFKKGGGGRKSLKVLKVEKSFLACFGHISIKIMLKINRERSERRNKWEKN